MPEIWATLRAAWDQLTFITVIDIAIVALLIYQIVINIQGRRAAQIVFGVLILLGVYVGAEFFQLQLVSTILTLLAPYTGSPQALSHEIDRLESETPQAAGQA